MRDMAGADVKFFFNQFVWTFDPRVLEWFPMVLWPKQSEYIDFVLSAVDDGVDFLCEKSRDMGVTYLNVGIAVHHFIFMPGFKTNFCANLEGLVDEIGNPDTIFEKARIIIRRMPSWLRPEGFSEANHSRVCRIINPANGNTMIGEGGPNAGRGGRSTLYFVDEAAHIDQADRVNAATSATARTRGWCSSVSGMGNFFAKLRHSGNVRVFRFHWSHDPRKDETWAEAEKARVGPVTFASEHDIDYGASIEGLVIMKTWIDAAVELRKRLAAAYVAPRGKAGLDVGAGKAESVCVIIKGALVLEPTGWRNPDLIDTAHRGLDRALEANVQVLNYDAPGAGFGVESILARADVRDLTVNGVNTGEPASERVWPDNRTSKDKFENAKAELWWQARERFIRSYQLLRHLDGHADGIPHAVEDVFLMADDLELQRQLNTPRWFRTETGKIMIERKAQLATRGVASPDRADAFILALYEGNPKLFYVG